VVSGCWIWKDFEGSGRGLILRYYEYTGIRLEEPRKALSQDSRFAGRDLYPGRPEHEAGVLSTRPRSSVVPMCWPRSRNTKCVCIVVWRGHDRSFNPRLGNTLIRCWLYLRANNVTTTSGRNCSAAHRRTYLQQYCTWSQPARQPKVDRSVGQLDSRTVIDHQVSGYLWPVQCDGRSFGRSVTHSPDKQLRS
jgi:hypothetical protein